MPVITICSNFGAQKNKISHCFHCFPIYLHIGDSIYFSSSDLFHRIIISRSIHVTANGIILFSFQFSSVELVSCVHSLWPYELQHAQPPCPSPTPGVHSDSCPSSWWCHPAISSSVIPFSSCRQSLPASKSFPMSQLFAWGGQSIEVSDLASLRPKNTQNWSPLFFYFLFFSFYEFLKFLLSSRWISF